MKIHVILISLFVLTSCNNQSNYKDLFNLAKEQTDKGNYSKAIDMLGDVIKLNPDFDSAYIERAYNYLHINKPEQALIDANKGYEITYNNMGACFIRGTAYVYMYEFDKALKDFNLIIDLSDSMYMDLALRERANIFYQVGEFEKSINDYSTIIDRDSLSYESYVSRGIVKLQNNVYDLYSDSISMAQSDTTLYNRLHKFFRVIYQSNSQKGIIYDTKGAIDDFSKAIEIKSDHSYAWYNRARVYNELNLQAMALNDINSAIALAENSDYYLTRALIYKSLKLSDKSLDDFNKAIETNPENGIAYINRAYLKKEQLNDAKGAENDIKMARKLGLRIDD